MNAPVRLAVVHHSVTGTTARLADAVRDGASSVDGVETFSVSISGHDIRSGRYRNDAALATAQFLGQRVAGLAGPMARGTELARALRM